MKSLRRSQATKEWKFDMAHPTAICRKCGDECRRHSTRVRRILDINESQPVTLVITTGTYRCAKCNVFFATDLENIAPKRGKYTKRIINLSLHYMKNNSIESTRWMLHEYSDINISEATLHEWKFLSDLHSLGTYHKRDIPKIKELGNKVLGIITEAFELDFDACQKNRCLKGIRLLTKT